MRLSHALFWLSPLLVVPVLAADPAAPAPALRETFDGPFSADWNWELGTWTAKDGVLRGFESGPRRHGPVKMRKFAFQNGTVEYEFRLEGKATFSGIVFNGSQERGHLVHLVIARDMTRLIVHPPDKGAPVTLLSETNPITPDAWHSVKVEINGPKITATIDGKAFSAESPIIGEEKLFLGLGGESGGPEGEKAGALEFRKLQATKAP